MVCKTSYYIVFVYNYCTSIGVPRDKLDVKVCIGISFFEHQVIAFL